MPTTTRGRIVETGAELFRRQGYAATAVKEIVTRASAPFGSVYHHFPGGKEQLAEEIVRTSGAQYGELVAAVFDPAPDPVTAVEWCFALAAENLRASDYTEACPIATVALEVASTHEALRIATADVFASWIDLVAERFVLAGVARDAARRLAFGVINALEGAFVLCRAARSTEALEVAGEQCVAYVRSVLAAAP